MNYLTRDMARRPDDPAAQRREAQMQCRRAEEVVDRLAPELAAEVRKRCLAAHVLCRHVAAARAARGEGPADCY